MKGVCRLVEVIIILQSKCECMHCSVQDGRQFVEPRSFLCIPGHSSVVYKTSGVMLEQ